MGKPTVTTQKRLFAVSGNRCAFRQCRQPLVDATSGKVTACLCYIKSNDPESKRYDSKQSETERQGFGNLLLMCPVHKDVVDADDVTFTSEVLITLKAEHEAKFEDRPPSEKSVEELFLANVSFEATNGSIILSANQSGGQVAHTIHNNYGTAPQPQSAFRSELARRHLADMDDPEFARTTYHKKMGFVQDNRVHPLQTTAIFFVHSPRPLLTVADEPAFLQWADCSKLRYEPCKGDSLIPGVYPDRIGAALIWTNGARSHAGPGYLCYTHYITLERAGWIEMGLHPVDPTGERHEVYYAQLVANLVGFLGLVRDIATHQKIDPAIFSLGVGLRGIKGAHLTCLTQRVVRGYTTITPPERNAMLFLRSSDDGPWDVDGVAHDFANALLDYWEFARPGWLAHPPEFEAGVYKGEFFRSRFDQW